MKPARAFWLLPYLLFSASLLHAAPPEANGKEVTIKADTLSIDVPAEQYRAQGAVRIEQDGVSLLADSVIYSRLSGDALAEGGVFLEKEGDTLKGERLSLNLISQQGELSNGELFVKRPNFRVRAQRLEKTGAEDYRLKRGSFTTCDGEKPSWRFEAREVVITLDEFATARDAVFYAGDIPLMYTPYLIFPVKRERQSGLLIPKFGQSSKKGIYLDLPYYWAINPSQEASFNLALESSRGVGLGADYRYLRSGGSEGRLQGFGIYDTGGGRFRGELNQSHLELLSPKTTLASNIHLLTDRDYYRDFGDFSGEYNRQLQVSTASIDHRWERYGFSGEFRYTEDLEAPNDTTLQKLPELNFIAAGSKLGPFFFSMDSGFVNFERIEGVTGQRLELHPRLTLYAKPAGALELSLYGGYHERLYNASGDQASGGIEQVGQADAGSVLSLPLERVYQGRLRHLLIPSLEYRFVQHGRDGDLPFFDWDDRVLGQSIASLSLASVVTGKYSEEGGAPQYRDLLYLKLSQGYQFSGERRDLLTLVDEGHRVADLMLESRANPVKGVSLAAEGRYNPVDGNLSTANLAVELTGEGDKLALLGYRHSRGELDYLEGRVAFPISARFSATALGRYSFDKGGLLESRYSLQYKQQCWSVIAAYSDRPGSSEIPHNREFTVNFTLAGIGVLGPIRAF
ncbi:MAG: lipopolysaccharide biosynthesis protein [Geobacteraceae bacterium GWC2_58_44]|nr:MAG: lipopolysaccharide biosynthesis protein [Geobacteraceae bacterium GWC2_58_44]HBG08133.1 lipopolysaccharide biosynthesis protein [Geobacter sp.]